MDFPRDSFPPLIRNAIMSQCEVGDYPIESVGAATLAVMSAAVQAYFNVSDPDPLLTDVTHPLSQYFLVIAESGKAKSSVFIRIKQGIDDAFKCRYAKFKEHEEIYNAEMEMFKLDSRSEHYSKEQRIELLKSKPKPPQSVQDQIEVSTTKGILDELAIGYPSLVLLNSEGGTFFKSYAMGKDNNGETSATFTKLWEDGSFSRKIGDGSRISVTNKRLSILLMVQSSMVTDFIHNPTLRGQGIHGRFHIVKACDWRMPIVDYKDQNRLARKKIIDNHLTAFRDRVFKLLTKEICMDEFGGIIPITIGWTGEAVDVVNDIANECAIIQHGARNVYEQRLRGHTLRMAGVIAAFTMDEPIITPNVVRLAFEIVKFFADQWENLDIEQTKSPQDERAEATERTILEELRKSPDGMSISQIVQRRFRAHRRDEVRKALENLHQLGTVDATERVSSSNRSPTVFYKLVEEQATPIADEPTPMVIPTADVPPEALESPTEACLDQAEAAERAKRLPPHITPEPQITATTAQAVAIMERIMARHAAAQARTN